MQKNESSSPQTLTLYHLRSSRSALSAGYRLYLNNFRRLFRGAWPVALAYAVATALLLWHTIYHRIPAAGGNRLPFANAGVDGTTLLTWCGLLLLFLVMAAVLASTAYASLAEHRTTEQIERPRHWYGRLRLPMTGRTLLVLVWLLLAGALAVGVVGGTSWLLGLLPQGGIGTTVLRVGVTTVVGLVVAVLLLPLTYTVTVHLLGDTSCLRPPLRGYGRGLSHVGMLFATALVVALVTLLLSLFTQLPALILASASVKSQIGMVYGDPTGMPESMSWVSLLVFALAGFVQAWLHLSMLFPFYYAYGSIEAEHRSRDAA